MTVIMRRLPLIEFQTKTGVPLTVAERDAVRRLHPGLRVEPSAGTEGRYDLTPDQRIGLVCLPSLVLEIQPKFPMSSVLYFVSHACDAATWSDQQPEFKNEPNLFEVLAIMLARMVEQATRRGLLNGYQTEDEALQAPRGRILFDEQLRRRLGVAPPVEVRHDVFTSDIVENRLLLAALMAFSRMSIQSRTAHQELLRARRLLGGVRSVHYAASNVPEVVFTRINRHYQAALSLATLILRSAAFDLGAGGARGAAFIIDMNVVFERFVRNALRQALGADVKDFPARSPKLHLDEAGVVPLKPDLCLLNSGRVVWVGDAKYKLLPSSAYRNADLYQLLAYTVAMGLPGGTLIYAADQGVNAAEHVVVKCGKRLQVVAINLEAPPIKIKEQLSAIASRIRFGTVRSSLIKQES